MRPLRLLSVVALLFGGTACGENARSVEAYCAKVRSEKDRILAQLNAGSDAAEAQSDGFASGLLGLGAGVQAIGELRTYFAELERVAPADIQPELEIIAEQFDQQLDAAGAAASDPLGGFASTFINGLAISGQLSTVGDYTRDQCGESL